MPVVSVTIADGDIARIESDALIACFFEDIRPLKGMAGRIDWLLCGALSQLILDRKISGSSGEIALLTARGKMPVNKIFLVGMGPAADITVTSFGSAARTAGACAANAGVRRMTMEFIKPVNAADAAWLTALESGLREGAGDRELVVSLLATDAHTKAALGTLLMQGAGRSPA